MYMYCPPGPQSLRPLPTMTTPHKRSLLLGWKAIIKYLLRRRDKKKKICFCCCCCCFFFFFWGGGNWGARAKFLGRIMSPMPPPPPAFLKIVVLTCVSSSATFCLNSMSSAWLSASRSLRLIISSLLCDRRNKNKEKEGKNQSNDWKLKLKFINSYSTNYNELHGIS